MCFKAYELSVSHLFQMKQHNILVSIGVSKQILSMMLYLYVFFLINANHVLASVDSIIDGLLFLQQEDEEGINPLIKVWNFDKVNLVISCID